MVLHITDFQSKNSSNSSNTYAKPKHELVFKFAKGNLKIAGSTMDLLMYISPFVDRDGRIVINLDDARRALNMQLKTFYLALEQSREQGLLVKRDGFYYSQFHEQIGEDVQGLQYQKILAEFSSPTVLNYSKNTKRLFYYFASFTLPGTKKKVSIEHLYRNQLHTTDYGVHYFDSFADLSKSMLTLIKNDQIIVQLMQDEKSNTGLILTKDTPNLEETFHTFFGAEHNSRKKRTSHLKTAKHKIKVELTKRVANKTIDVMATDYEFRILSDQHGICWEEMNIETRNYLASYKNTLCNLFGEIGISIYRDSIADYLKDNAELVLYHDLVTNKTANYVMDFYILKTIRGILEIAALHKNILRSKTAAVAILCNKYLIPTKLIPGLLSYYLEHGSENHIVLLDAALTTNLVDYTTFEIGKKLWTILDDDVHSVYRERYSEFKDVIDIPDWKLLCQAWAKEGLLTQKKEFNDMVDELKVTINTPSRFRRKRYTSVYDQSTIQRFTVPFYNWLEDRS